MGELVQNGAKAIVWAKLRQESKTGIVTTSSLEEYWNFVLTASTREEYREQARACIERVGQVLAQQANDAAVS